MNLIQINRRIVSVLLIAMLLFSPLAQAMEDKAPEGTTTKLVIQISEDDASKQHLALSNVYNLQKFYGMDNIEIEVVAYGPGISLLYPEGKESSRVRSLIAQDVTFTGCQNTLDTIKAKSGTEPKLIEDVEIVRAGIARIIELQDMGYRYLHP